MNLEAEQLKLGCYITYPPSSPFLISPLQQSFFLSLLANQPPIFTLLFFPPEKSFFFQHLKQLNPHSHLRPLLVLKSFIFFPQSKKVGSHYPEKDSGSS